MARLTPLQRAILAGFKQLDPGGEVQFNVWYGGLEKAIKGAARDAGLEDTFGWQRELQGLVRRKFLAAEGRGNWRQYGITKEGLEAVA